MGTIEVIETLGSVSATPEVPRAGAVWHISIHTSELIAWPSIDMTFDKPILRAVLHMPEDGGCYSNCLFAQGRQLVRLSFDGPPFDSAHPVDVTIYSVDAVHVASAGVRSIYLERSAARCCDGRDLVAVDTV